jgi:molybdate/tungstate transport system substrate-binding protein
MKRIGRKLIPGLLLVLTALLLSYRQDARQSVSIFIAGSLIEPFKALEAAYEAENPDFDIKVEAHGSIQVIRHVTEIHDLIDIVIPADYRLIPMMMYSHRVPETGDPYANYALQIARNRLVLTYTPQSRYANEINADNWYEILARKDVKFGLSDPRFDAAGYRSLMILQLAEQYYQDPSIFEKIFLGRFKNPITVYKEAGQQVIKVPELLEIKEGSNVVLRGGSVALLALLESGDVDYAFEYESVAQQHDLSAIRLPVELSLSDPSYAEWYAKVRVKLDYQRFSTVTPEFEGEVITYGLTIPSNAPNPEGALGFIQFFLGTEGKKIMEANFHPMLPSIAVDNEEYLPDRLFMLIPR